MQAVIGIMIFSGAFATASVAIAATVVPQWRRIIRLAAGNREIAFAPFIFARPCRAADRGQALGVRAGSRTDPPFARRRLIRAYW